MRNARAMVMILVALVAGLAAVFFASRWLLEKSGGGGKVAVALADVNLGQRLMPDMIKIVDWPSGSVPEGAFGDPKQLDGRVLKTSVLRGEPILESKLAPVGTKGGLSAVIAEGKRAITVRVNDVIGVAGFALPGNYVDIIVGTQKEGGRNDKDQSISKIVLERILVLAVAQEVSRDETKPRVVNAVTLEVSPEEAEKLDLARSVGTLSLVLRNQIDPNPSTTDGVTKAVLLRGKEPPKAAARPAVRRVAAVVPERNCVGVMNGLRGSQECY